MNDVPIALVELFGHSEVLYNYNRILRTAGYKVNNYTSVEIRDDAPIELKESIQLKWICQSKDESVTSFIEKLRPELEENALILFITLAEPLSYFSQLRFKAPSILVVHDYFAFFEGAPYFMIAKDTPGNFVKDLLKVGRYFVRRELSLTQQAVSNFDRWAVPAESVYQFVKKKNGPLADRLCGSLDFALFEEYIPPDTTNHVIKIVVPGIVSDKSRDYFLLLRAFEQIKATLATDIQLTLLGTLKGGYGQKIKAGFQQLAGDRLEVITFERYIQQEEFDQTLRNADFLLLPIKQKMKYSIYGELNGYTCVSGNMNDILRFGIPAILPLSYPVDSRLKPLVSAYADEKELVDMLQNWIRHKAYSKKRLEGRSGCMHFSEQALAQKFKSIIDTLIISPAPPPSSQS